MCATADSQPFTPSVMPSVNQLEYHPWVEPAVHELVRWCQSKGIAITAYGSLGSSATGARNMAAGVAEVAAKYKTTNAALLLNWALARGCAVIPGATSVEHIRENLHLRRFSLTAEDEEKIAGAERPVSWRLWKNMKCSLGDKGGCARDSIQ